MADLNGRNAVITSGFGRWEGDDDVLATAGVSDLGWAVGAGQRIAMYLFLSR